MGSQSTAVKPAKSGLSTSSSAVKTSGKRQVIDENTGAPKGTGDIKRNPAPPKSKVPVPEARVPIIEKPKVSTELSGDTIIKNAKDTMDRLNTERIAQEEAAKKKQAEDAAAAQAAAEKEQTDLLERQTARGRQKAKAIADYGRSDTILTSPLGLPSGPSAKSKKTLLGM